RSMVGVYRSLTRLSHWNWGTPCPLLPLGRDAKMPTDGREGGGGVLAYGQAVMGWIWGRSARVSRRKGEPTDEKRKADDGLGFRLVHLLEGNFEFALSGVPWPNWKAECLERGPLGLERGKGCKALPIATKELGSGLFSGASYWLL